MLFFSIPFCYLRNLIENINTIEGDERYMKVLQKAQEKNLQLGYGDSRKEWKKKAYNVTRRMLMKGISEQTCKGAGKLTFQK